MTLTSLDTGSVLRTLLQANAQFVVVGDPAAEGVVRVVVSAHPTNLDAVGRALDRLSATARVSDGPGGGATPARVGDPLGTVTVETSAGEVHLLVGGQRHSLYAETLAASSERELDGVTVRWAAEPAAPPAAVRATGRVAGGRLLSLAGRLAHLVERRAERDADASGGPAHDGAASPDAPTPGASGTPGVGDTAPD